MFKAMIYETCPDVLEKNWGTTFCMFEENIFINCNITIHMKKNKVAILGYFINEYKS